MNKYNSELEKYFFFEFKEMIKFSDNYFYKLSDKKWFSYGGNNGPHFHLESPVRNTCHWIVSLLIGYDLFNDSDLLVKAQKLGNWLLDKNNFYQKKSYIMRQRKGSDFVNGVIGPSWILEALARLVKYTHNRAAKNRANEIIDTLKFNKKEGGWHRYDPNIKKYSIDYTFNHQAWLAASMCDCGKVNDVKVFLDRLCERNYDINEDGRIFHLLKTNSLKANLLRLKYHMNKNLAKEIENGYHLYCLYPLARLAMFFKDHKFFKSDKFTKSLKYCSVNNILKMDQTRYGFEYNAPGLEIQMIYYVFGDKMPLTQNDIFSIYHKQFKITGDAVTKLHTKNNPDPMTMASRTYELAIFLEAAKKNTNNEN